MFANFLGWFPSKSQREQQEIHPYLASKTRVLCWTPTKRLAHEGSSAQWSNIISYKGVFEHRTTPNHGISSCSNFEQDFGGIHYSQRTAFFFLDQSPYLPTTFGCVWKQDNYFLPNSLWIISPGAKQHFSHNMPLKTLILFISVFFHVTTIVSAFPGCYFDDVFNSKSPGFQLFSIFSGCYKHRISNIYRSNSFPPKHVCWLSIS